MSTAIWWVRRDLRLTDNQALTAALAQAEQIVPVFIFDPDLLNSPYVGSKRLAFLQGGLRALDAELQDRGSRLIVRRDNPIEVLTELLSTSGADAIFAEEDFSPFARRRDKAVAQDLPLTLVGGQTVRPPSAVLKSDNSPYTVYTPYSKTWKSLSLPEKKDLHPAPTKISTPAELASEAIPSEPPLPDSVPFKPGEAEAQRRFNAFVEGDEAAIFRYADRRNRPDLDGTSQLSPYLRFGMLSVRQTVVKALEVHASAPGSAARKGVETWLNELIWREFYISILYHFPHVRQKNFRSDYDTISWNNDEANFAAWCKGLTGYPIVDAAMRQLAQSGWMHNRARMIVASFLVKDLLIDWRWGEKWFMQHLVDGDPAANNGGWQWSAGTGTDAAPYFRIFNPTLQGQKHDPNGNYGRRWLPELAGVPDKYIHEPHKMPLNEQKQAGCILGEDYPEPIVDHSSARERTLNAYRRAKESAG